MDKRLYNYNRIRMLYRDILKYGMKYSMRYKYDNGTMKLSNDDDGEYYYYFWWKGV